MANASSEYRGLKRLHDRYSVIDAETIPGLEFHEAYKRAARDRRRSLVDILVVASSVKVFSGQDLEDLDPRLVDAVRATSPGLVETRFSGISEDQLQGVVNAAKGKYFEYLVVDRLNSGQRVGDVVLPEGYRAELASSMTQPGWDMRIVGQDNEVSSYLQLKATDSLSYIKEALRRYPDIEILATQEVADGSGLVLNSEIMEDYVREQVDAAIDVMDDTVLERLAGAVAPLIPLSVLVATEGYKVYTGQKSLDDALGSAVVRGQRMATAGTAALMIGVLGGGLLAIPAAFGAGMLFDRIMNQDAMVQAYKRSIDRMEALRKQYASNESVRGMSWEF